MNKQQLFLTLLCLASLLSPAIASKPDAQPTIPTNQEITISRQGYCVFQLMPNNAQGVLVLYYNTAKQLVRKEYRWINQTDLNNTRVKRSMKKSLREAIATHEDI